MNFFLVFDIKNCHKIIHYDFAVVFALLTNKLKFFVKLYTSEGFYEIFIEHLIVSDNSLTTNHCLSYLKQQSKVSIIESRS